MSAVLSRPLPAGTDARVLERLFPTPNPYLHDPDGWATQRLGVESWSIPRLIRESVRDNRHTAVPACHESAKTHTAASIAAWWLDVHPVGEAFVVSSAPTNPQVTALLWRDIKAMHMKAGLRGRITLDARWFMDDQLVGFGRKTADETDPNKAMQAFQGVHARYPLVIIDEAGGIPKWLFDAADSIAANDNGRVLAIGNPDDPTSHFAELCRPGTKYNVLPISAFDTPAMSDEPVSESLLDLLISKTYVDELAALGEDTHLYQSKVLGQFPDVSDDALFPPRFILRAQTQDLPGDDGNGGTARGGYALDVARFGTDKTVLYRNRGGVIRLVKEIAKNDTEETADFVEETLAAHGSGAHHMPVVVDGVGVGAGVVDKLRRRGFRAVIDFNGGTKPLTRGRRYKYVNRRSEVFWALREGMEDGTVDLDPADKELAAQLGRIKFEILTGDYIRVETKQEMRKRGVKSPDRADAASMAYVVPSTLDLPDVGDSMPRYATESGPRVGSLTGDLLERAM